MLQTAELQDLQSFAPIQFQNFSKISWNFFGFLPKILQKIAIFQRFSSNFAPILIKISRNFAEYSKKWWAIPKMLNFQWILADFSWIPTEFWPNFDVKNSIYSIARQSNLSTLVPEEEPDGRRAARSAEGWTIRLASDRINRIFDIRIRSKFCQNLRNFDRIR